MSKCWAETPVYINDLPKNRHLFLNSRKCVYSWDHGRHFASGCVHESFRAAEKCGHDINEWEQAKEIVILYEGDIVRE